MQAARIQVRAVAKVAAITLLVIAFALLLALIVLHVRTTIRWVFAALFLTLALLPAVDLVERRVRVRGRGMPRWLAILVVFVMLFAFLVFLVLQVIPPIVHEIGNLASQLPNYVNDFKNWASQSDEFRQLNAKFDLISTLKGQASSLPSALGSAAGTLQGATVSLVTNLIAGITILALTFFLLLDGREHAARAADRLPPNGAERARRIGTRIAAVVKGYVSVNVVLAVLAGVFTWVLLEILGVDLALPMAVLVGFLDLIPLIGLTIGGALVAIVAALHSIPALIVWGAAFLVYQQLQDRVIQPILYGSAVKIHPAVAIIAVLMGAQLAGILGALLAIPTAAALLVVIEELWAARPGAEESGAQSAPEPAPAAD